MMDIPNFYADRYVFLTGATGFIGKVLLEKILRCCPDVSGIYVLIRSKKKQTPHKRLQTLLQSPLFAKVLQSYPECKSRIIPVEGDTLSINFGLREKDMQEIKKNVSILFHCAASVGFQDPLKDALDANVRSIDHMLKLIKEMNKFEVLVHLSTAYAYCYQKHTDEVVYPTTVKALELLNPPSWMTEDVINRLAPDLQGDHPNSYTYTKSLGENLLQQNAPKHQTAIVRPSIVTATWKEPMPGWCDSLNGPVGIIIAFGKGMLRTMLGNRESVANFVPVDIVVNLMIASAWQVVTQRSETGIRVYNCTSCESNKFYWGEMSECVTASAKNLPLDNPVRIPSYSTRISPFYVKHKLEWIFCHWIPAFIGDLSLCLMLKKPRFIKSYKRIQSMCDCLNFFTMGSWTWNTDNVKKLRGALSKQDREMFYFDTSAIDWKQHMADYHAGVKTFILKENIKDVPKTKKWIVYRQYISSVFSSLFVLVVCRRNWDGLLWLLLKVAKRVFKIASYICQWS